MSEDENYIFVQETYMVEYRVSRDEADNFLQESRKKNIKDFSRGSKTPIRFNQSVSVQDSHSMYRPGPGDESNFLGEDQNQNENREPTVSKGSGLNDQSKVESKAGKEMEKDKTTMSGSEQESQKK